MKLLRIAAMVACLVAPVAVGQGTSPLRVGMTLSKSTVMLGEPVWVDVTATNQSKKAQWVDWGTSCCGAIEIAIKVPQASQGNGVPKPCGGAEAMPCGCASEGPRQMAAGEVVTRRYVVKGDFRITHPGQYTVEVSKKLRHEEVVEGKRPQIWSKETQPWNVTLQLTVTDPNPAKLLAMEQAMAVEVTTPWKRSELKVSEGLDHEAYMKAVRAWSDEDRKDSDRQMKLQYATRAGLAEYPVAGMEPEFVRMRALDALERLNTKEAREAVAKMTEPVPVRVENGVRQTNERWVAIRVLGEMGDKKYLPLLRKYVFDDDREVRRSAMMALRKLGAESELPLLNEVAHKGQTLEDRNTAIIEMGRMGSAKAVAYLLDDFKLENADGPDVLNSALTWLTHHKVKGLTWHSPAKEYEGAWRTWWALHGKTAHIFGEDDCAPYDR